MSISARGTSLPRVLLLALLGLSLCAGGARAGDRGDKLLFVGNINLAPVVYLDNEAAAGLGVDLVNAVAKHISKPVEIRAMDWQEAQQLVLRGQADALIQMNPNAERTLLYDFSDPLLESKFTIFTAAARTEIGGLSELRGLRVGVEPGGLPKMLLKDVPGIKLTNFHTFPEGFALLADGAVDAVVADYLVGSYVAAKNNIRDIRVASEPIALSSSAIAVKKGNAALLAEINDALRAIKADGTYEAILKKWQPTEVVFETLEQRARNRMLVFMLVASALLLSTLVWVIALRRELSRRKAAERRQRQDLEEFVKALANAVEMRDPYTAGHQRRVSELAVAISKELGLPEETVIGVGFAASIHDLGKISVPTDLLTRPTRLTSLEFEFAKAHSQSGYEILKGINFPWPIASIVRQHHERLDGTGYPQGLKGSQILLEARIIAVADVVEAMSSHRPYREAVKIEVALDEIKRGRGVIFDAAVVDACVKQFSEKKFAFSLAH